MEDTLVRAARMLDDMEARILIRYAAGETLADIAINLEIGKMTVSQVVKGKGRGNPGYARNLVKARNELRESVIAARATVNGPAVPDGRDVIGPAPRGFAVLNHSVTAGRPKPAAAPRKKPVAVVAAAEPVPPVDLGEVIDEAELHVGNVIREAEPVEHPVDGDAEVREADTPATDSDDTVAAGADSASPVAEEEPAEEDTDMPARNPRKAAPTATIDDTSVIPSPRTGSRTTTAAEPAAAEPVKAAEPVALAEPEPELAAPEPAGPETFEQLLTRAEGCDNPDLQVVAKNLRSELDRLGEALGIDAQASVLRTRIAEVDAEIAERTERRDALRAELEQLMASDVMVSASSGSLRRTAPAAEPDPMVVRMWARKNDYEVGDAGRIPGGIMAAYKRANGYEL